MNKKGFLLLDTVLWFSFGIVILISVMSIIVQDEKLLSSSTITSNMQLQFTNINNFILHDIENSKWGTGGNGEVEVTQNSMILNGINYVVENNKLYRVDKNKHEIGIGKFTFKILNSSNEEVENNYNDTDWKYTLKFFQEKNGIILEKDYNISFFKNKTLLE